MAPVLARMAAKPVQEVVSELLRMAAASAKRANENSRLKNYWPQGAMIPWHNASTKHRESAVLGGNQIGKSVGLCAQAAFHALGEYPKWYKGKRILIPNTGVVCGKTLLLNRDKLQATLCGFPDGELGTGFLPKDSILDVAPSGIKNGYESVAVRHISGGTSRILFRAYEQGRANLQSLTLDWAALDEEPPEDVYFELLTRTNITRGPVMVVFTPLLGATQVVGRFYGPSKHPESYCLQFGLDQCELYDEETKAKMRRDYPEHEREARAEGRPVLGSGLVFPVAWESISCDPFSIPPHWPRICGVDFGIAHPFSALWCAWDRDNDIWHLYDEYVESGGTTILHAAAIKSRPGAEWIPVAWPHDGLQRSKDTGIQLSESFRTNGVNMLQEMATHEPTGQPHETQQSLISVEAGIDQMLQRMQTGRWKVFRTLTKWRDEYRQYHRVNGVLVKLNDDALSGSRVAFMMRRFATTEPVKINMQRGASSWRT